jgi:hypothetical protein
MRSCKPCLAFVVAVGAAALIAACAKEEDSDVKAEVSCTHDTDNARYEYEPWRFIRK